VNDDCLKLTTYFGERDRTEDRLVADSLLQIYGQHEIASSVLLRGVEGFGLRHHLRTDRLLTLSEDLPVVSIALDTRRRIEEALDEVMRLNRRGLVTLERARMLSDGFESVKLPDDLNEATKLTIYLGRQERVAGRPAFMAICDLLHRSGVAGATVLLGVDGTLRGRRQRARFFDRNAEVPMMLIAVGPGERITAALPEIGHLVKRPLVSLERIRVCKRDGNLLERPLALPAKDAHGMGLWQKLMVHTSEAAEHDGHPIHRQIVRRLRESGGSGATVLRGMWGYHGAHAPHGDRLLQLRRHAPMLTVVVDSPDRIASSFELIDELTQDSGLVTSEMVPALTTIAGQEQRGGLRLAQHRY